MRHHAGAIRVVGAGGAAALVGFGLFVGHTELLLNLFGDDVATVGDLAREGADAIGDDIERRQARAHVNHRDRLICRQTARKLEQVLDRERVDVANHRL